jgi:polyhydroxyalkanoate synthesis regulator phasin
MDIKSRGVTTTPSEKIMTTQKTDGKKAVEFSSVLSSSAAQKSAPAEKVAQLMEGLQAIANDVKQGKMSKEEAGRQFVSSVIRQTHLKSYVKDIKKMESAVADAIEQDPIFVSKLETQLKKIGQMS